MEWPEHDNKLTKEFSFPDFASALAFVNAVGAIAEELGHHPDIRLSWGKVIVATWTHSENGITQKDHELTRRIDEIYPR